MNNSMQKYIFYSVVLVLLLLFAVLLRSKIFFFGDFNFYVDQARDLVLVKDIVVDKNMTLIGARSGVGGIFHGPLWIYFLIPTFLLSGGDPFFTLVPVFIGVSLSIILLGFLLFWKLYDFLTGILFALFISVSSSLIKTVPSTTNAQVMPLILVLYLYTLIESLRGNRKYFIANIFFIGIGIHFESAFAILLFPLSIFSLFIMKKKVNIRILLFAGFAFLASISNYLLFDVRHDFLMTRSAVNLITGGKEPIKGYEHFSDTTFRIFDRIEHLKNSVTSYSFEQSDPIFYFTVSILVLSLLVLFLSEKSFKKTIQNNIEYILILLLPLYIFGAYILYPFPLWEHYILPITVTSALSVTYASSILLKKAQTKVIGFLFIAVIVMPAFQWVQSNYLGNFSYQTSSDGSYRNQLSVVEWVFSDSSGELSYLVYSPGVLTYNMDYLIWWKNRKNEKNIKNVKTGSTYLILYPEANDSAHEFWKRNVVKLNGSMINKKNFNSGISVEKYDLSKDFVPVDQNYYMNLHFR